MSKYKWPRRFFWWDELPKSGYGKIPKHMVRDQLFARADLIAWVEGRNVEGGAA